MDPFAKQSNKILQFSVRGRLILETNPFSNLGLYSVVSENSSDNLPNLSARTPPSIQLYASSYQFNYTNNSSTASTYSAPSQKESMSKSFSIPQYIVTINQKVSETSNQLSQKRSFDEFTKKSLRTMRLIPRQIKKKSTCPGRYDNKNCPYYRFTNQYALCYLYVS